MSDNELLPAIVNELTPMDLFTKEHMEGVIAYVHKRATEHKADLETVGSRKAIASNSHMVSKSKTALEAIGTTLMAKKKAEIKSFNEVMKMMKDAFDKIRDESRIKLTEWESAKKAREAELAEFANELERGVEFDATADQMKVRMTELMECIFPADLDGGQTEKLDMVRRNTWNRINEMYLSQIKIEAEQAELSELRKKDNARINEEAAEKRAKEIAQIEIDKAEKKAEDKRLLELAEIEKSNRAAAEAMQKAKDAEMLAAQEKALREASEKQAADEKAKREQDEKDRLEREEKAAIDADIKKAQNREQVVVAFFELGLDTEQSQKVVGAIEDGKIPGVSINI